MQRRNLLALVLAALVAACGDHQGTPTESSNTPDLASASINSTLRINVLLKAPATTSQRAELGKYGTIYDEIAQINAVLMRVKAGQVDAIRALPFVQAVSQDAVRDIGPIDLVSAVDFAGTNTVWNQDAVNVKQWGTTNRQVAYDGDGVYVAVLDTGLLPSWRAYFPQERIATQYAKSFGGGGVAGNNVSEQPNKWEDDVNAHGTHVSSIILGYQYFAASTGGFFKVDGVAPKVKVIPVKVLNQNGGGWSSTIAHGIVYVADLAAGPLSGHRVIINMSLGGPVLDAVEQAAIDYAIGKGVVTVAAAGNSGPNGAMGFPGAYAPVISVAAAGWIGEWATSPTNTCAALANGVDALTPNRWWRQCDVPDPFDASNFYITGFSSKRIGANQDLDVAAPGSWVVGPYQTNQGQLSFFFVGGTSQASPHVAGIVALMLQKNPNLSAAQVETILEGAAHSLPYTGQQVRPGPGAALAAVPSWDADRSGAGLITADAALSATP